MCMVVRGQKEKGEGEKKKKRQKKKGSLFPSKHARFPKEHGWGMDCQDKHQDIPAYNFIQQNPSPVAVVRDTALVGGT